MKTAYQRAFESLNPSSFRAVAFFSSLMILGINKLIGGSWRGLLINGLAICVVTFLLPARRPQNLLRLKILAAFRAAHRTARPVKIICFVSTAGVVVALQYLAGGFPAGRGFNLFLVPIFVSSLLFGLRTALAAWPFAVLLAYYCIVPPYFSFRLEDPLHFADLIIFSYECLMAAVIAVIFYESSVLANNDISIELASKRMG
jgi:K+-sensing histidine kinase KdpD